MHTTDIYKYMASLCMAALQLTRREVSFVYIAQNHNQIASVGFTVVTPTSVLRPLLQLRKNSPEKEKTWSKGKIRNYYNNC